MQVQQKDGGQPESHDAGTSSVVTRPIQRVILIGVLAFTVVFGILMSALSYITLSATLYRNYETNLRNVITYVENNADADDIRQCFEFNRTSTKYDVLQRFLNGMVDDMGLEYLYIVIPEKDYMVNVVSATRARAREAGEEDMPFQEITYAYPPEELARYRACWDADGVQYFEEVSEYGSFYTACKPLRDSIGETVALICADYSLENLYRSQHQLLAQSIIITVLVFGVFSSLLILWSRRNVTNPIMLLEKSARDYAQKVNNVEDAREVQYEKPQLNTKNELQSLGDAIDKMVGNLRSSANEAIEAEIRAVEAETEAENMTKIAYRDALTHVKSKAAYDNDMIEFEKRIADGRARFGLVMVDLNDLKGVNDEHGHDAGDDYIVGACEIVCDVFKHSPVYRIGGDEFVVVLEGHDYENREALLGELRARFDRAASNLEVEAQKRYSAACGMAMYEPGDTLEQVFKRADESMYRDKQTAKGRLDGADDKAGS